MYITQAYQLLRDALADLYSDEASARRVVDDATINLLQIHWNNSPINFWQSIMKEAVKQGKVDNIITVAKEEYKCNPDLQNAIAAIDQVTIALTNTSTDANQASNFNQFQGFNIPQLREGMSNQQIATGNDNIQASNSSITINR